jgi:protoporphyrinogen oxidase
VNEGDEFWNMSEKEFSDFGTKEMVKMGLIESTDLVLDTHMEKVKKAYPAYFDTYENIDELIAYLNTIDNLYCVGRNGQHRYNNIDHSMVTSFETVKNILSGSKDKSNIWNVNTEQEYHEEKK